MVDRPMLEAVVFDAGGTLVRLDFEWMSAIVREYGYDVSAPELRRAEVAGRRRYDRSHSALWSDAAQPLGARGDVRWYFGGMLLAAGLPHHSIEILVVRFLSRERQSGLWARQNEGARTVLDQVAQLGLRRCVVSNSDGRAAHHLKNSGVLEGHEFVVDSQLVGVEKPDPRIFQIALGRMGVAPDRALYVGDIRSVDEVGSAAAGMHFVLIDPSDDYAADGAPRIASIGELPAHIEARFQIASSRSVAAGTR
ncbi:MAG: HAD family hydrolase [Candidatus Eisenbacteria bacterium]|uniref:HAD family hydrolase n=1 Tax=Eiseniibacteriota bacterium TaxID=2212470 RepID=A0A849SE49_UNCEI|nr:HAD family hydrolase [Candidatus Eisenbacteria bacterium]